MKQERCTLWPNSRSHSDSHPHSHPQKSSLSTRSLQATQSFQQPALLRHDDPLLQTKTPSPLSPTSAAAPKSKPGSLRRKGSMNASTVQKMTAESSFDRHGSDLLEQMVKKSSSRPNSASRVKKKSGLAGKGNMVQLSATPGPPRTRKLSTERTLR